jgi:hypothetical protein
MDNKQRFEHIFCFTDEPSQKLSEIEEEGFELVSSSTMFAGKEIFHSLFFKRPVAN